MPENQTDDKKWSFKLFQKAKKPPFINKHPIDDYIDEFWSRKCPERYSVLEINEAVRDLMHEILMKEYLTARQDQSNSNPDYTEPTMSLDKENKPQGMIFRKATLTN